MLKWTEDRARSGGWLLSKGMYETLVVGENLCYCRPRTFEWRSCFCFYSQSTRDHFAVILPNKHSLNESLGTCSILGRPSATPKKRSNSSLPSPQLGYLMDVVPTMGSSASLGTRFVIGRHHSIFIQMIASDDSFFSDDSSSNSIHIWHMCCALFVCFARWFTTCSGSSLQCLNAVNIFSFQRNDGEHLSKARNGWRPVDLNNTSIRANSAVGRNFNSARIGANSEISHWKILISGPTL